MMNPDEHILEAVSIPPAATLTEARAAYVGRRYPFFEESFSLFDEARGFRPTFIWQALFFDMLWFIYRRMYLEAVLIVLAQLFLAKLVGAISEDLGLALLLIFSFKLALSLSGRWLYWKAVDRRLEQAIRLFPHEPDRALAWLKLKGGVDHWTVILLLVVQVILSYVLGSWAHQ